METLAKQAAGNWRKFDSFAWHDQPEDADNWAIVYTNNRDSRLVDQSNAKAVAEILAPFVESGDVVEEHHGHWAVGWVDGYSIRVYRAGEITEAFKTWLDIQERLEDYPLLDEDDHSRMEYESTIENLQNEGYDSDLYDAPDNWTGEVFTWLWNNGNTLENRDDQGGYATREQIHEAMEALGYRILHKVTWIDCGLETEYFDDEWDVIERCAELKRAGFYPKLTQENEGV